MATDISAALQSIPEKKELLQKAFGDLEEQRATIARCTRGWNDLDSNLTEIQEALEKRHAEILEKETKVVELQAALDNREKVIESREQASLARVQEQKDAAVAAIREQKRKWIEERQLLQSQSAAKPDPDTTSSKTKQSKVSPKDEAFSKEKVNTARDTSASKAKKAKEENPGSASKANNESSKVTLEAGSLEKGNESSKEEKSAKPEPEVETDDMQENTPEKQDGEQEEDNEEYDAEEVEDEAQDMVDDEDGASTDNEDGSDDVTEDEEKKNEEEVSNKKEESFKPSLKSWPELKSLCENMDGPGLRTFVTSQKKDINTLRKYLPMALKCASDPSKLVLLALEGYHSCNKASQTKKLANRKSCVTLLESLAVVLADLRKDGNVVSSSVKEEVKKVAESWKSKLNPKATDHSALLDAQSFLQLLVTYGIARVYDEDELCEIVIPISTRKDIPALWCKLGLAEKVPEIVDRLIKDGKQLDAVTYIQDYGLSERFPPVPLLKAYLKDIRKGHSSKSSSEEKDELHMKELNATKAVLKCIDKYKFEAEYSTDGLQKRVLQLERVQPEKKRNLESGVGGSKKPRINGPHSAPSRQHFGGRVMRGHNYGSQGGRGGYSYSPGGPGYGASSYSHRSYKYGGGPRSNQGSHMR